MLQLINTTRDVGCAIYSVLLSNDCGITMIRLVLIVVVVPSVISIIVNDPPPSDILYKYSYDIEDPTTGDKKTQYEVKQGDIVTGQYSVVDPDGTKRIVDYNVHPSKGFTAVVHTEPANPPQNPTRVNNYVIPLNSPEELRQVSATSNPYYSTDRALDQGSLTSFPQTKDDQPASAIYFTPANEILDSKASFPQGQYFIPYQRV